MDDRVSFFCEALRTLYARGEPAMVLVRFAAEFWGGESIDITEELSQHYGVRVCK